MNGSRLKALTRHMVARVGGQKVAATVCGCSVNDISLWGNDNSERFIPVDHLLLLDAAAGDLFLKEYAASRGYQLSGGDPKPLQTSIIQTIADLSKVTGELECTALKAAEDGTVCPRERRDIFDLVAPVEDRISQLKALVSA